jgi:prepilin-type N-terminal cleavage/methylation domain-containing protein
VDGGNPPVFRLLIQFSIYNFQFEVKISNFKFQISNSGGYTLVELLVTLAIVGFLAVIAFYGLRGADAGQKLTGAQKNFLSDLRAMSNQAANGAGGSAYKTVAISSASQYLVGGRTVTLPTGVTMDAAGLTICFAHPALTAYTASQCGSCLTGSFFACRAGTPVSSGTITVVFTSAGGETKRVNIEGNNMTVNRVYAP